MALPLLWNVKEDLAPSIKMTSVVASKSVLEVALIAQACTPSEKSNTVVWFCLEERRWMVTSCSHFLKRQPVITVNNSSCLCSDLHARMLEFLIGRRKLISRTWEVCGWECRGDHELLLSEEEFRSKIREDAEMQVWKHRLGGRGPRPRPRPRPRARRCIWTVGGRWRRWWWVWGGTASVDHPERVIQTHASATPPRDRLFRPVGIDWGIWGPPTRDVDVWMRLQMAKGMWWRWQILRSFIISGWRIRSTKPRKCQTWFMFTHQVPHSMMNGYMRVWYDAWAAPRRDWPCETVQSRPKLDTIKKGD